MRRLLARDPALKEEYDAHVAAEAKGGGAGDALNGSAARCGAPAIPKQCSLLVRSAWVAWIQDRGHRVIHGAAMRGVRAAA